MPEMLSDSCVMAVMRESDSWVLVAMRARIWPMRCCTKAIRGMKMRATRVSCQLRMAIEMSEATTVTELPTTLLTVLVSAFETPPTSFCNRDWMTPVLVRVKKETSIVCSRW